MLHQKAKGELKIPGLLLDPVKGHAATSSCSSTYMSSHTPLRAWLVLPPSYEPPRRIHGHGRRKRKVVVSFVMRAQRKETESPRCYKGSTTIKYSIIYNEMSMKYFLKFATNFYLTKKSCFYNFQN